LLVVNRGTQKPGAWCSGNALAAGAQRVANRSYFTTSAIVCNTPDVARTPCNQNPVTLGLVGLHIRQQVSPGRTMFCSVFANYRLISTQ